MGCVREAGCKEDAHSRPSPRKGVSTTVLCCRGPVGSLVGSDGGMERASNKIRRAAWVVARDTGKPVIIYICRWWVALALRGLFAG